MEFTYGALPHRTSDFWAPAGQDRSPPPLLSPPRNWLPPTIPPTTSRASTMSPITPPPPLIGIGTPPSPPPLPRPASRTCPVSTCAFGFSVIDGSSLVSDR